MLEPNESLSERELEILRLVATGAANKEIARQLVISPNTVKVHLRNIFAKIGVASRTEATLYAIQIGLVNPTNAVTAAEEDDAAGIAEPAHSDGSARSDGSAHSNGPESLADAAPADSAHASAALTQPAPTAVPTHGTIPRFRFSPTIIGLMVFAAFLLVGGTALSMRWLIPATAASTVVSQTNQASQSFSQWTSHTELPSARAGMGIAEYESAFFLFGGETAGGIDGASLRYSPADNTWEALANKTTPVTEVQAALLGEKIYVPGGRMANGQVTDRLEIFDPRSNTWEDRAPLPVPLSAYALATFEGRLYLFGGKNGEQYMQTVWVYDPQEDRWREGSPLSSPRAYASATTVGTRILVLGGYDGQQALRLNEAYLPVRDANGEPAWESLPPLPDGRYKMGAVHLSGLVFVLGGADSQHAPAVKSLRYQVQSRQWIQFDTPASPLGMAPALLTSSNHVYILGGQLKDHLSAANFSYQAMYTIAIPALSNDQ